MNFTQDESKREIFFLKKKTTTTTIEFKDEITHIRQMCDVNAFFPLSYKGICKNKEKQKCYCGEHLVLC